MKKLFLILIFPCLAICCGGSNIFSFLEKKRPAVEAVKALEAKDPEKAKSIIFAELSPEYKAIYDCITAQSDSSVVEADFHNEMLSLISKKGDQIPKLISILASAEAQSVGVDPLDIALALAKGKSSSNLIDDQSQMLTLLFPILPDPTQQNITVVDTAVSLLRSIGEEYLSESDKLKLGIFLTSSMSLSLKFVDKNSDGKISVSDVSEMTDDLANSILSQLDSASSVLNQQTNTTGVGASDNIKKILEEIDSQDGASRAEKLKNFLASKQASGGG